MDVHWINLERNTMDARKFSYRWPIKVMQVIFFLGGIIFLISRIGLIISGFRLAAEFGNLRGILLLGVSVLLVVLLVLYICVAYVDFFPDVVIDPKGVTVGYLLDNIHIPWENVIRVESSKAPIFSQRKDQFVFTRSFPFPYRANHALRGMSHPGFIISSYINDYELLVSEIQARMTSRQSVLS
jgi:hypothetical protein